MTKSDRKQSLAFSVVTDFPLFDATQHEAKIPSVLTAHRLPMVSRRASVKSHMHRFVKESSAAVMARMRSDFIV